MNINQFWKDILAQNAEAIRTYFVASAHINWHNTNEHFTVEEFIRANCEYPGEWDGEVERVICTGDQIITATHVYTRDKSLSLHVASFIRVDGDKIVSIDEYWGDDSDAPQWRQDKHLGTKIK